MGKMIPPDERAVYLAFKNVFKGPDAAARTAKTVRKRIEKHKDDNDEIRALVQEHNLDHLVHVVKALLEAEIFESTLKAKIRFPEVFDVSPAQSAERAVSEAEAARTEAGAIREVEKAVREQRDPATAVQSAGPSTGGAELHVPVNQSAPLPSVAKGVLLPHTRAARSLYPVYIPAKSQRRLLGKVQDVLELACYAFARRTMPEELQRQGWDGPDCVELNIWTGLFRKQPDLFDSDRIIHLGKPLPDFLTSIAQIRHTAVHRLRITAGKLETFLADAEALPVLLAEEPKAYQLSGWRRETRFAIEEFERNKDLLELRRLEKCREIAARRAELDGLEAAAWESMVEEDRQYQSFAGANIERAIESPVTALHSAVNSDTGDASTEDLSGVDSEGDV